jgi:CRISPR system Cascade subunit CasC
MLIEAGDRQPRSLAGAFRKPCKADLEDAASAFAGHLKALDEAYATGEARRYLSLATHLLPGADKTSLQGLAEWASKHVIEAPHD